jgi:glycosyltransferase involved in cell wall biosynthesis
MNINLISIIIPCYNQSSYLEETLNCILKQDYENWECLLVNDGSTDSTESVILPWLKKDPRFRYFSIPNGGVSAARNFGIEQAKGFFIQFLDADDLLSPNKLSKSIGAIFSENVGVVCCNYALLSNNLTTNLGVFSTLEEYSFTFKNIARYWKSGFTIPIHCFFFRREVIGEYRFPVGISIHEDWIMWLLIYQQNPNTYFIPETLAFYRSNPTGLSGTGRFVEETLFAIDYLNPKLSKDHFKILYEGVIMRFNEGLIYWRKREENLKQSKTYQFGLIFNKFVRKVGLFTLAKKCLGNFPF